VHAPRQLKVYVGLGPPAGPIRGEIELPSGKRTAFSGWIGFVAAIEAARGPTPVDGQPIAHGEESPRQPPRTTDMPVERVGSSGVNRDRRIDERGPDSLEPLEVPDVPEVAGDGSRTTMRSSDNGDGSADHGVRHGGRDAAPAAIERGGASEQLRHKPRVSVLGYVSAEDTARIGNPELKRQAAAIEDFCAREGWELVRLVRDIQPATGRCLNRPALSYAIERLGRGDASALVVAELARLCRSVAELREIFDALMRADARLVSLEPEIDTGTEFGRAAAEIVSAVSEWERARRSEHTRKGLAAARAQGAAPSAIKPQLKRRIVRMRAAGLTLQAIADDLNEEGIPTARGGTKWRPSSVQAALGYKRPSRRQPREAEARPKGGE
jgi:DNA invertase Pin-like site-specific DNA recombinase